MKPIARFLVLASAALAAFVSVSKAQPATFSTVATYNGGGLVQFGASGNNAIRAQTFTDISAISSLTYNFFKSGATSSAANFTATFAQWNTSTLVWDSLVSFGSFTVPASGSWTTLTNGNGTFATFAQTFNFGGYYLTNATSTYAMILTNTSGSTTDFGLGTVFDAFSYGSTGYTSGFPGSFDSGSDYTFSQIVVVPNGNVVPPVPESSTVAAILGVMLVGGLVTFRLRQQRQMALATVGQQVA